MCRLPCDSNGQAQCYAGVARSDKPTVSDMLLFHVTNEQQRECGGMHRRITCGLTTNSAGSGNGRSVSRGFLQRSGLCGKSAQHIRVSSSYHQTAPGYLRLALHARALQELPMGWSSA